MVADILMHCNSKCSHVERAEYKLFTAVRIILLKSVVNQYAMEECARSSDYNCVLAITRMLKEKKQKSAKQSTHFK